MSAVAFAIEITLELAPGFNAARAARGSSAVGFELTAGTAPAIARHVRHSFPYG
jgi:hypothetical protein